MNSKKRIIEFLKENGWYLQGCDSDYASYTKDDCIGIDIDETEIVFIDGNGDFLHIPCEYYSFIGALYVHRINGFDMRYV